MSNLYLLIVVTVGWVIFRYSDVRLGLALVRSMFGLNGNALTDFIATIQLQSNMYLLLAAVVASLPLMRYLKGKLEALTARQRALEVVWNIVFYSVIPVVLLLLSTACLVGNSYNPFIYFRF